MSTPALMLLLLFGPSGCEESPSSKSTPAPSSQASKPSATTTATATAAATAVAEALPVAALKKELKCPAPRSTDPCDVLDNFASCVPTDKVVPSGDGRWMGVGYVVKAGEYTEQITLVRARRVPLVDVGPGQLPIKVSIVKLPDEETVAHRHAMKAINKLKRDDVPRKDNAAIDYVKKRQEWPEAFATPAKENQVYIAVEGGAYLCERSNQRMIVVKRDKARKHAADGLYAVLWPVSW